MSGIFGLFLAEPIEIPPGVASTASRLLSPCGSEESNLWQTRSCLLGVSHPRPAGVLQSGGLSTNESGRIHAVCEGGLLNTPAIRHRLERGGHTVACGGDAGVLAHLGEGRQGDWELSLRGSFACAVWDDCERALRLSVDRFGARSLYWLGDERWIAFATSLPVLRGMLLEWGREEPSVAVPPSLAGWLQDSGWRVDPQAVRGYLDTGCIAAPLSICRFVHSVPPAGRLTWRAGATPVIETWWTPRALPVRTLSLRKAIPEFLQLFRETLPLYLCKGNANALQVSADPASAFLCHEAASLCGLSCVARAFFVEETCPREAQAVRGIAASLPFEYQEYHLPPPCGNDLPSLVQAMSEPCGHPSAWNAFAAIRVAGQLPGIWVAGLGSYAAWEVCLPKAYRLMRHTDPWLREVARYHLDPQGSFWKGLLSSTDWTGPSPFDHPEGNEAHDPERLHNLRMHFLLPCIDLRPLHVVASMHSLDVRLPWLDPILSEWMVHLPRDLKVSGGYSYWLVRKTLQAGAYSLPPSMLSMASFNSQPPVDRWLSRDLAPLFQDTVLSSGSLTGPLFQSLRLRQAFEAHRAGVVQLGRQLWAVLLLELWLRENRLAL